MSVNLAAARASGAWAPGAVCRSGRVARLVRLYLGLAGFGVSLALLVRARLGLGPWDVLHQGIARHLGVQLGWVTIGVSGLVLLAWIPLRQRPGLGTVSNAVIVGLVVNGALEVLPTPGSLAWRTAWLAAGIGLNGLATACYIGAGLGPGPRDGLMTGIAARGYSLRVVRTLIELSVLAIGFALGGTVGVGTVAYALSIGPLTHLLLPRLTITTPPGTKGSRDHDGADLRGGRARLRRPGRRSSRSGPGG
jgi:uncharacterized membrane protein YczE